MLQYADECRTLEIPFIFDPGQQCARMSGDELAQGLEAAAVLILNDYELELLKQKTEVDEATLVARTGMLVVTRGENGSSLITSQGQVDVPAVEPFRIVDPTGVGDAFRGGFMKGLVAGADAETCGRMGSVAATYALEHLGGTSHCVQPRGVRAAVRRAIWSVERGVVGPETERAVGRGFSPGDGCRP